MRFVIVAGFTQTPSSWNAVHTELAELDRTNTTTLTVGTATSWFDTVERLANDGGRGIWCGYSMGGRLALSVALARPELVEHLVLVSATAGIVNPDERAQRIKADNELADTIERDGVPGFVEKWLTQPMFNDIPSNAPGLTDRTTIPAATLASHLRVLGTGMMPNHWDDLQRLTMPVTIVTGTRDAKFDAIGDAMLTTIDPTTSTGRVQRIRIESGHAIPLVAPRDLARALHTEKSAAAKNIESTN